MASATAFSDTVCVSSRRLSGKQLFQLKGSDWLCKVVELSMQCCGKLLSDSFETYYTF